MIMDNIYTISIKQWMQNKNKNERYLFLRWKQTNAMDLA